MSAVTPPEGQKPASEVDAAEVPLEYSDAYQRAYRRSLAEHATELMSPARPGKRALEPAAAKPWRAKAEAWVADVLVDPRRRTLAGAVAAVGLVVLAYAAGRLLA